MKKGQGEIYGKNGEREQKYDCIQSNGFTLSGDSTDQDAGGLAPENGILNRRQYTGEMRKEQTRNL